MNVVHPLNNAIGLIESGLRYEVEHGVVDTSRDGMPVELKLLDCPALEAASQQSSIGPIDMVSITNLERRTAADINNDPYLFLDWKGAIVRINGVMKGGTNQTGYDIFLFSEYPNMLVVSTLAGIVSSIRHNNGPNISLKAVKKYGIPFDQNSDSIMMDNVSNMLAAVATTQPSH